MESFGEKLRSTRESLGYSIEQIARDTHIAKRYLIALENEDFSIFPGETYLKGFLQNYAEYLGLDTNEMIAIYKNMKIQEQPIPLDQLLEKKTGIRRLPAVLGIGSVLIVIAAVIVIFAVANPFYGVGSGDSKTDEAKNSEIVFNGRKTPNIEAAKGFLIKVPLSSGTVTVTVQRVVDNGMSLVYGTNVVDFIIGDAKQIDLDGDGVSDIAIILGPINTVQNRKIALLTIQPPAGTDALPSDISDRELLSQGAAKVISESSQPVRFTVNVTVVKNCLFITYVDSRDREEKWCYKGETFTVSADRSISLRCSDGGAIKLNAAGTDIETGRGGDLFAARMKWIKTGENKYELVLIPEK